MTYVIPPDEVFLLTRRPLEETQGAYEIPAFENLSFSEKEGMVANYSRRPFQRKGLVYPEAVEVNNIIKKIVVALFHSIVSPKSFLDEFIRICDYAYRNQYLARRFYCKFSRELWELTYLFCRKLGISGEKAYRLGRIVAHLFQYEENYRFWGQDLFGQTNKEALISNPKREFKKMLSIFSSRIKVNVGYKLQALVKIFSFVLFIPKIRNAWKFAIRGINLENLKLDEADRWWALASADYDLEDRPIADRFKEHVDTYNWHQVKLLKQQIINNQTNAT